MTTATADIAARIDRSMGQLDAATAAMLRDQVRADATAREVAEEQRRDRLRRHQDACKAHQVRYDEAFSLFGKKAPMPAADAFPGDYRRSLFRIGQSILPPEHELVDGLDPDLLDTSTIKAFEPQLLAALADEAEVPSESNLPKDGSMIVRHRMDDSTGQRVTRYYGRRSFIHDFCGPVQRIVSFNGKDGTVLWPPEAHAARIRVGDPILKNL
jgi:hypothetical protein